MILRTIALLTALLSLASAYPVVTAPAAGDTITGLSLSISWKDNNESPTISDLANYQIFLCAGGNDDDNFIQLATLVSAGDYADGNKATATFTAGIGANEKNAYFLKIVSAATGGTIINYSDRFTLSSVDGVFTAVVTEGLQTVTGTAGPATVNDITAVQAGDPGNSAPAAGASEYNVPYTMQTGTIRYAPMPPMAQTKITAKNASPQWPTSSYTVYKTNVGPPNAATTQTAVLSFSTSSRENTAAAAGQPTDAAMQKFLERWKD